MSTNEFENVKVGDKVFVDESRYGVGDYRIHEVTRVTKTQFTAGERNFMIRNGFRVGDGEWDKVWAQLYDPAKHDGLIARRKAKRERDGKVARIKGTNLHTLTDAQLDAIIAILDAVPHEVGA